MSAFPVVGLLVVLSVVGYYFLKVASGKDRAFTSLEFQPGAGLYVVTAIGTLIAMRHMSLAALGVRYALVTIVLMASLGLSVFGERLTGRGVAGLLFAFALLALLNRSA